MANGVGAPFRKRQPIKRPTSIADSLKSTPQPLDDSLANAQRLIGILNKTTPGVPKGTGVPLSTIIDPNITKSRLRSGAGGEEQFREGPEGDIIALTPQRQDTSVVTALAETSDVERRKIARDRSLAKTPFPIPEEKVVAQPKVETKRATGVPTFAPATATDIPLIAAGRGRRGVVSVPPAELEAREPGFLDAFEDPNFRKALLAAGTQLLEASAPGSTIADVSRSALTGVEVFEQTEAARKKAEVAGRREERAEEKLGLERSKAVRERKFQEGGKSFSVLTDAEGKDILGSKKEIGTTGAGQQPSVIKTVNWLLENKVAGTPTEAFSMANRAAQRETTEKEFTLDLFKALSKDELLSDAERSTKLSEGVQFFQSLQPPKATGANVVSGTKTPARKLTGNTATDSVIKELNKKEQTDTTAGMTRIGIDRNTGRPVFRDSEGKTFLGG